MLRRHKFNEKKLLHKIGKQWVTVSIVTVGLIAGGVVISQPNVNADANTKPQVEAPNNSNDKSDNTENNDDKPLDTTKSVNKKWDNVNVTYYPDDTMELTGTGTIKSSPKPLPFNTDKNDWKLVIDGNKGTRITLGNNNGNQFSTYDYNDEKVSNGPIWRHFKSMDLSGLNTSNITNMSGMFAGDYNLKSLDISGFDTNNVPTDVNSSNVGMNDMFINTSIEKFILGNKTDLNKANQNLEMLYYKYHNSQYISNGIIDSNGNDATNEIQNGTQPAGTYYLAAFKPLDIYLESSNQKISNQPGNNNYYKIALPIVHDDNYQRIIDNQVKKLYPYLSVSDGYRINDRQNYTIHNTNNSNDNFKPYVELDLIKDSNVHYQSDIKSDMSTLTSYSKRFRFDWGAAGDDHDAEAIMENCDRAVGIANEKIHRDEFIPNSYTDNDASLQLQSAESAFNEASSVASSAETSASQAASDDSSDNDYPQSQSHHDQPQTSSSNNYSMGTFVDSAGDSTEINSLNAKVDSYSTELSKMNYRLQSLENNISKGQAYNGDHKGKRTRVRKHINMHRHNTVALPKTGSAYWTHFRPVKVKHGFKAYRVHLLSKHRVKIIGSKKIKSNQKLYVMRSMRHGLKRRWLLKSHQLRNSRNYHWIFKNDRFHPNHFKRS